ncbi:MAG: discoidin domain-containing protein [Planctomycetaceae bacterium]|nr:discoidin domain-containing protein [Planctomycetaceae bacterium]
MHRFRNFWLILLLACHVYSWVGDGCIGQSQVVGQVLDPLPLLEREKFWKNRDFPWYMEHIPILETPDADLNTTYYYRWELVTRHLTYGSPNSGYSITEFSDRPFWSGAYGSIACPAGHQINEIRWLRDPRYVRDYLRYWFRTPGAEPTRYSFWAAASAWAAHEVHPNAEYLVDLLPDLIRNYETWYARHYVPEVGLFWQTGHDDGMEFDINARQTKDILRGGQSLRPSFNAYQWADAVAISRIADLAGQATVAAKYRDIAAGLKQKSQELLWDPNRKFFFPMSNQRHEHEGHVVEKYTLTYQTGKFAGSPAGRELHGYVPWAFRMPDAGYEAAWQYLMDPNYFAAEFGPTTVERHDPMFLLQPSCCWWSGQSWPFATTQTLKAMANVLHFYDQEYVSRQDYYRLLRRYALSHRKDGVPYIAEALHPDTGSWDGHDAPNHSNHYFHSGFIDLVITGLLGVQADAGDTLIVNPLAPLEWDYFAIDRLAYRGQLLSVLWDRDGKRFGKGAGFFVYANGKQVAFRRDLGKLELKLNETAEVPVLSTQRLNYAVNNDGDWFPRYDATHTESGSSLHYLHDGQYRYDLTPNNRWSSGLTNEKVAVTLDYGMDRQIDEVKLYVLDDENDHLSVPQQIELQFEQDGRWQLIPDQVLPQQQILGGRPWTIRFPALTTKRLRVVLTPQNGRSCGLTEIETWGTGTLPYAPAGPPAGNVAFRLPGAEFPRVSASHSDRFGGRPELAIDGRISYLPTPFNRWTSYESTQNEDWYEVDFGQDTKVARAVLHLYDDRGGVQPPQSFRIEYWNDGEWQQVDAEKHEPLEPTGSQANHVQFSPVVTTKLRVLFVHRGSAKSGLTELEIWRE